MREPLDLFGRRRRLKVRQVAAIYDVTERTVYRWIEKGAVDVERTPGGGVRIFVECEDRRHSMTNQVIE